MQVFSFEKYTDIQINQLVKQTLTDFYHQEPLVAYAFTHIPLKPSKAIPTAAVVVKGKTLQNPFPTLEILYNPDYIRSTCKIYFENSSNSSTRLAKYNNIKGVLLHEIKHVLLNHLPRLKERSYDQHKWNIATDLYINSHIPDLYEIPGICRIENYDFPYGLTADQYYQLLTDENMEKNGHGRGKSGGLDVHGIGWNELSPEEQNYIKEYVNGVASEAVKYARSQGSGTSSFLEEILAAQKPQISWTRYLERILSKQVKASRKRSYKKPSRREQAISSDPSKRHFQGSVSQYESKVLCAFDTSGSVTSEEISKYIAETNQILSHKKLDLMQFDYELTSGPEKFTRKSKLNIHSRGGTNFFIPIEVAKTEGYEVVIIFTDGYADIPPKPTDLHVIWCISTDAPNPPYGDVVRLK